MAQLSHGAERLFWRLTTVADDFGRFEADPMVMLAQCFPNMLHRVKIRDIQAWLAEARTCDLLRTYANNGKMFGFFVTWPTYQIKRAKHSKYPEPPPDSMCEQMSPRSESSDTPRSEKREARKPSEPDGSPAAQILTWLNQKAGRTFRPVPANLDFIRARLADGIQPWQLKAIISRKTREWSKDPTTAPYLRPATLFNKTKCEQYLGELPPETEASHAD